MEKSVYKKGNKEIIAKAYREQGKLRIVILLQFKIAGIGSYVSEVEIQRGKLNLDIIYNWLGIVEKAVVEEIGKLIKEMITEPEEELTMINRGTFGFEYIYSKLTEFIKREGSKEGSLPVDKGNKKGRTVLYDSDKNLGYMKGADINSFLIEESELHWNRKDLINNLKFNGLLETGKGQGNMKGLRVGEDIIKFYCIKMPSEREEGVQ